MFSKTTVAITALLAAAEAVKVTKPAKGDEWDLSKTNEITWETVSTDPKTFEIVIVNQSAYPETTETVAKVNSADGKYELKDVKASAGEKYRINFISTDPQNSGILAQSQEFSLTSDDSDDKSSSASASATATGSTSASGSASATATGASSSGSATASVTKTASGLTTVTTGTATATATATESSASNASASGSAAASASGSASGTATGAAASGTSTSVPASGASAIKSTFAIFGSVAVAAYMLF